MADSKIKRRKEEEEHDGTDLMSILPDSLVCHILSFLSIKNAVATSLVSRRWRHLWKYRQVFHFWDDSHCYTTQLKLFKKFAFFVNAVLSLRTSRDIRKFRLYSGISDEQKFPSNCINMWITAAIGPHLQELDLDIANPDGDQILILPSSLLNCTNLVSLSLVGAIEMKVQHSSVHFPSLKWLKLDMRVMDSDIAFLSGCPVLKTLHIYFEPKFLTNVPVPPSSKKVKFNNGNFSWTCLEIKSHRLRSAKTTLGIIGNVHSVVEAYLDVFCERESEFVDPILNRLRDPDNALYLLLRHSTKKWPLCAPVINNPVFCNLLHLKFILPCFNSNLLVNIIEKCHILQVLILQIDKEEPSLLGACELQSTTVPKCLKSHLTYIHIEGYQGLEEELTFAEYILLNGLVLKTMLIFVDISMDITNKYRSLKRLTRSPKGSEMCQLEFDADGSP